MSKFIYNTLGFQTNEQKQQKQQQIEQKQQQIEQGIEPIELSNDNSRFDVIKKMYNIIVEFNKKYNINLFDAYPKIDYLHIREDDIEKNNKYKYPLRDQLIYDEISYVAFIKYNTANRYELDFTKYDYKYMSSASAFYPIMKTIHEKLNNNNNDNNDNSTIKNSIYHLLDNAKTNKLQDIREAYHERLDGSYIREIREIASDSSEDKIIRDRLEKNKIHDKFESSKIYTIFAILSCVYYYNDQKDRDIESYTKFINQIENTEYSSQQGGKRKTNRKNIKKNKSTKKINKKSRKTHKKRKN